ncbi:phosphopeptide-binding protein [Aliidongia dinghuensis]|uniref:Phosphopeptide-binding protein n=1 Tax=Aliidongia dinghuensis TaxID=1867774 RepID=A0A8J2YX07_9PROT|nr:type VI secretion system-associated FHA domain protein TagH [Aliidongia dinghuensis]GGF34589.1 phosphopeptide-binding protein [Aliidongia dinghuensis]
MTLTLAILRCPDGVPPETRRLSGGSLSIGRSPTAGWVLPDPDRVLSKQHCVVSFEGNAWHVTDTSANGTFVNHELVRLPPDEPRQLRSGDRLLLGSYEIEAAIEQPGAAPSRAAVEDRLVGDPFPSIDADYLGIALPLNDRPADPLAGFARTTPDHVSALAQNFRPPRPVVEVLPADWDLDLPPPPPLAAPTPEPAALPPELPTPEPPKPEPPKPELRAQPAIQSLPTAGTPEARAFAAFAAGAGIETPPPADPLETLASLGAAFRAFVGGLRQAMIARAAVKGEFRIDQTMIQAVGNNPLKFSADDEDAMTALLGVGRRTGMTAEQAVAEAMRDIRLHELAMAAAMQQAVRDLLASLEPSRIEGRAPADALDFLPWRRAARQWRAYQDLHHTTTRALADDFDTVFGLSFMRAYERALSEVSADRPDAAAGERDR